MGSTSTDKCNEFMPLCNVSDDSDELDSKNVSTYSKRRWTERWLRLMNKTSFPVEEENICENVDCIKERERLYCHKLSCIHGKKSIVARAVQTDVSGISPTKSQSVAKGLHRMRRLQKDAVSSQMLILKMKQTKLLFQLSKAEKSSAFWNDVSNLLKVKPKQEPALTVAAWTSKMKQLHLQIRSKKDVEGKKKVQKMRFDKNIDAQ